MKNRGSVVLFLTLRVVTLILAPLLALSRPLTQIEKLVPFWPPSPPTARWLERIFISPWERWDAVWYAKIVGQGYSAGDGTAAFNPLFPMLAKPAFWLTGLPILGLLLVSSIASVCLLKAFEALARLDLEPDAARTSTLLLVTCPVAFSLFVPYTESTFLLMSVLCLYWARGQRWWWAGFAAGLATLTRQQGVFLALPLAWELWEASGRKFREAVCQWANWLSIVLIPVCLLPWIAYRAFVLNDFSTTTKSSVSFLGELLISPSTDKVVSVYAFMWPWQSLGLALHKLQAAPEYSLCIDLTLGAIFVVLTVVTWPGMRISYRLYVLMILFVSFSDHTGPVYPYMGLPRHLFLAFPVFIGLGTFFGSIWSRLFGVAVGSLGLFFLLWLYLIHGWVP